MTWFHRSAHLLVVSWVVASGATTSLAADLEDVSFRLREAREKYVETQQYLILYNIKTEISRTIQGLQAGRAEQDAYVRKLKVVIDGYPARRNNLQEADHQEWLMARNILIEIDRRLGECAAQMREVDEQALALTAMNKNRPLPNNRRDIQGVYPIIQQECDEQFRLLRESADEFARANGTNRDEVIGRAMATLGRPKEVELQYGSTKQFLAEFKKHCAGKRAIAAPAPKRRR